MPKPKVSTLLLTVAFLTAAVAAANFYVGRNEERAKRIWTEEQLRQVTEARAALQKERDELTQAKQGLEEQVAALNNQAKALADQVAQEKRAREALTTELAQTRKESNQYRDQAQAERKEKADLTGELAKAKQSYQALSNELTTLRQAKEALEKRVKEMLAARAKEAEQIVVRPAEAVRGSTGSPRTESGSVRPEPFGSAAHPEPVEGERPAQGRLVEGRGGLEGKVLVVNREFNFVVLNLGSKDGLKSGARFAVLKGDRRVGTVEVERLYENMSSANVLEEEKKGDVKEGDVVRLAQ